jgi:hypothetical protein
MASEQVRGRRPQRAGGLITPLVASLFVAACQSQGTKVDLASEERAIRQASIDFSNAETSGKPAEPVKEFETRGGPSLLSLGPRARRGAWGD